MDLSRYGWDGRTDHKGGDLCVQASGTHLSLPSDFGIGTLGQDACDFIDFLASADVHVWEIMPICHTDSSFSPAQCSLCPGRQSPAHRPAAPLWIRGVFSSRELSRWTGDGPCQDQLFKVAAAKYKALEMVFDALGSLPDSSFDRFREDNQTGWRTMPLLPSMSSSSICPCRSGEMEWPGVPMRSWTGCASVWTGASGSMSTCSTCSMGSGGQLRRYAAQKGVRPHGVNDLQAARNQCGAVDRSCCQ